tara:strand:- start:465 stop:590 length:126 start_codon:yes stop_codon:yes gene_type:complete
MQKSTSLKTINKEKLREIRLKKLEKNLKKNLIKRKNVKKNG